MNLILFAPVLWPFVAAALCWLIGRRSKAARTVFTRLVGLTELVLVVAMSVLLDGTPTLVLPKYCGLGLSFTLDGFRRVYIVVAAVLWAGTLFFSGEYFAHYHHRNRYYLFNLLTLGAAMGVFLSADLMTTFVFFEIMSFTSYTWVAHDETKPALRAAETYLGVAVIGGMVALMGLFLLGHELGTLQIDQLTSAAETANKTTLYIAAACLLVGFGAKAGMFPLHIWLPKAHPVAPAPASALLSGLLTKTGVFGVLVLCGQLLPEDHAWGMVILLLGTVTMVLGAVLALFSVDLKRTLACSSMSQIGFILVGAGALCLLGHHNALAARGAILHMVNHSLFKLVLFLCAGAVYMNLHKLNLNDIRGFGRRKPILHFAFLMGALGIGGIPLWSGYISKTLLHEALVELGSSFVAVEWLFLFSGGLTLAYMTKLYICLFWQKHPTRQAEFDAMGQGMNPRSAITLLIAAIIIPILGMSGWMDKIADLSMGFVTHAHMEHAVHYFAWINLKGAVISVAIGAAMYLLVVRTWLMRKGEYIDRWPAKLDLEELVYRPLIHGLYVAFGAVTRAVIDLPDAIVALVGRTLFAPATELPSTRMTRTTAWRVGHELDHMNEKRHKHSHFARLFYRISQTLSDTTARITGSLSFSLLMACVGVCLLMFYLLYNFAR